MACVELKDIFEESGRNAKSITLALFVIVAILIISPLFEDYYILRLSIFVIFIVSGFYLYQDRKNEDQKVSTFPFLLTSALGAMLIGIAYLVGESLFRLTVLNSANQDIKEIFHKIIFFSDDLKTTEISQLEAGQVGDFIGGLMNPLIAFSSLIVLTITLVVVYRGMMHSKESADMFKNQFLIQRFEETFFSIFEVLIELKKDLPDYSLSLLVEEVCKENCTIESHMDLGVLRLKLIERDDFASFFRLLYQLLKQVKSFDESHVVNQFDPKKYVSIVRSILKNDIYYLLMINCMTDDDTENFVKYKDMLIQFSFLEHMRIDDVLKIEYKDLMLLAIKHYYCKEGYRVFGDNKNFLRYLAK